MKKYVLLLLSVLCCQCNAWDPDMPQGKSFIKQDRLPACSIVETDKSGVHIQWRIRMDALLNTSLDQVRFYYAEDNGLPDPAWQSLDLSGRFAGHTEVDLTLSNLKPATAYRYRLYLANPFTEDYPVQSRFTTRPAAWVQTGVVPPAVHGRQVVKAGGQTILITDYTCAAGFTITRPPLEHNQLWAFDPAGMEWKYITQAPFIGRTQFVCFGLHDQVFIGLGYRHTGIVRNIYSYVDWWCYDLKTDTWTRKKDFGGLKDNLMTFFSAAGKGYMLSGSETNEQELPEHGRESLHLYEYQPLTDTWKEKAPFPGQKLTRGASFVIGDRAWVYGGTYGGYSYVDENFSEYMPAYYVDDVWEYECLNDRWHKRSVFPGGDRTQMANGVAAGNKGFAGCGLAEVNYEAVWPLDWWGYLPETDEWIAYPAPPFQPDFTFEQEGIVFIGKNDGELCKYIEW